MRIGDRYDIGERIGAGGSGTVFRAVDLRLRRPVAIKVIESSSRGATERQLAEMRTMASVTGHRNIVALFDAVAPAAAETAATPGRAVLVMELVDGPSLATVLRDGSLPLGVVRTLGTDVAAALAHLQLSGIVHRDVKPANILVAPDGTAKLADFGISRLMDSGALTPTGFLVGTSGYLSPEQVEGRGATAASDVYSLGLILLEAVTGAREYQGSDTEAALARLARQPTVPDDLPASLAVLLTEMLARDPAARPSAAEVRSRLSSVDLREAPAALAAEGEADDTAELDRAGRPGWLWPVLAAAVLLVAVLLGAGRIALSDDPGPRRTAGSDTADSELGGAGPAASQPAGADQAGADTAGSSTTGSPMAEPSSPGAVPSGPAAALDPADSGAGAGPAGTAASVDAASDGPAGTTAAAAGPAPSAGQSAGSASGTGEEPSAAAPTAGAAPPAGGGVVAPAPAAPSEPTTTPPGLQKDRPGNSGNAPGHTKTK